MAAFEVTDPTTGVSLELEGDSPPTEQELEQIFSQFGGAQDAGITTASDTIVDGNNGLEQPALSDIEQRRKRTADTGKAALESIAAFGSSVVAEPIAGLAGLAQAVNPFADKGAGARAVEATREALTLKPRTEIAQEGLKALGEGIVGQAAQKFQQAVKFAGNKTLEATGSPALAAFVETAPTAALEILGVKAAPLARIAKTLPPAPISEKKLFREIEEAAPTIDQLKETSRSIYKEIDELGAEIDAGAMSGLVDQLQKTAKDGGVDPVITPKASRALARFEEVSGVPTTVTDLDNLRKVAQNSAKSLEPAESAAGMRLIDTVDSFLDNLPASKIKSATVEGADVAKRYKAARSIWGRARKSELIQDSFEKAKNQASGFQNGIVTQFRSILNSKKQSRFFTDSEKKIMKNIVRGDKKQNLAKLIGRLGFSEGGATNVLSSLAGSAGGAAVFGAPGAVIVPIIGQVSRKLAQRMTAKKAEFLDSVIRAGGNAEGIVNAYLRNTPKAQRSAQELSELLIDPSIILGKIPSKSKLAQEAAQIAKARRQQLAGVTAAGGVSAEINNQEEI